MKRYWKLLVPNWSHLDEIWRSAKPFAFGPSGPTIYRPLDGLCRIQWRRAVEFFVSDRPTEVRKFLKDGSYCRAEFRSLRFHRMKRLPRTQSLYSACPRQQDPRIARFSCGSAKALAFTKPRLARSADEHEFHIERQQSHQGWVGPQSRISPKATLTPPYWIKGRCDIAMAPK